LATQADIESLLGIVKAKRTSDSAARNSGNTGTNYADDDVLTNITLAANTLYKVEFCLIFNNGIGYAKAQLTHPALTGVSGVFYNVNAAAAGTGMGFVILPIGNAGGTLKLQWAQQTSDASNTILAAGSYLKAIPI